MSTLWCYVVQKTIVIMRLSTAIVAFSLLSSLGQANNSISLNPLISSDTPVIASRDLAYFSEQKVTLTLSLTGAIQCPTLRAKLIQIAHRLEAELENRSPLDCGKVSPPTDQAAWNFSFTFNVPIVERISRFEWRYYNCNAEGERCVSLSRLPFTAYPTDLLDPLRKWARKNVLVVRDPEGNLQNFLDQQKIEYHVRHIPPESGGRIVTMMVDRNGEITSRKIAPHLEKGNVIAFREATPTLPLVKSTDSGGHRLIVVEMVLLPRLKSDPAAQKLFFNIFQTLQKEEMGQ